MQFEVFKTVKLYTLFGYTHTHTLITCPLDIKASYFNQPLLYTRFLVDTSFRSQLIDINVQLQFLSRTRSASGVKLVICVGVHIYIRECEG